MEEKEKQFQVQAVDFEGQIASLTTSLKQADEQQTNIQPLKEHVLAQRRIMHQLQVSIEEKRCKILQVDNRMEEILETTSYFVDRSQDILEVLTGRIERMEANAEMLADLPAKDQQSFLSLKFQIISSVHFFPLLNQACVFSRNICNMCRVIEAK